MELGIIKAEDLEFSGAIEDDRTNAYVILNDYDWMNYTLSTKFKTKKYGILQVTFNYFGANFSTMDVIQTKNDKLKEYHFSYSTDIFKKYIIIFLSHHIAAWDLNYAFNGEDDVLAFYNDVIQLSD
jgi:hypothetical protein